MNGRKEYDRQDQREHRDPLPLRLQHAQDRHAQEEGLKQDNVRLRPAIVGKKILSQNLNSFRTVNNAVSNGWERISRQAARKNA